MNKISDTQILKIVLLMLMLVMMAVIFDTFSKLRDKEVEYVNQIEVLEEKIFDLEIENDKIMDYYILLTNCCNENELKMYKKDYNYEKGY